MADPTSVKPVGGSAAGDDDSAFWSNNPRGIPLQALFGANKGSGEIGMRLKAHDVSGDGYLDKTEFRNAISNEIAAVKSTKQLKMVVLVLAALVVAICGVMTGLTYAVVEMSKETGIASNGVMTKKGTNEAVQVAHATSHSKLTSKLPDEAFEQMEKLEVISPTGSRLVMNVLGWARVMDKDACDGNYVRLVTAEGKVKLDGSAMTFDAAVDSFFAEVGFATNPSAGGMRRLASVFKIIAILNAVKDYANLDEECERKPGFNYASFTMEMDVSYPCPKKPSSNISEYTMCVKDNPLRKDGSYKIGSLLAGTTPDGKRIVHKQRLEYDEPSKVFALVSQYAEFPGFAHVNVRNAQGAMDSGYEYQTELGGNRGLNPSDVEVYKCRQSGDASDPTKAPAFSTKLGEKLVDGRTLREFEFLNPIDPIALAMMTGKSNRSDGGLDQLNIYSPDDTMDTLVERDGKMYIRTLYYDWKNTGAPHSFMVPQPGGTYIIFNVTYFAWGSQNAERWALTGGASSLKCKADPQKTTPASPAWLVDLSHGAYRQNPGLVVSNEQRDALKQISASDFRSAGPPMSRRVRRLIESPHELTVEERLFGGRASDDYEEFMERARVMHEAEMQTDHYNISSRRELYNTGSLEFGFKSKKLEFGIEGSSKDGEEYTIKLSAKAECTDPKPKDGFLWHKWCAKGGGMQIGWQMWGLTEISGWQTTTGTLGDEKCVKKGPVNLGCAGLESTIEFNLGGGYVNSDFCGSSEGFANIYAAVDWTGRACIGGCVTAKGSGKLALLIDPGNRQLGGGCGKIFPGITISGELSIGVSAGPLTVDWCLEGELKREF